jgi:hypothetical protein
MNRNTTTRSLIAATLLAVIPVTAEAQIGLSSSILAIGVQATKNSTLTLVASGSPTIGSFTENATTAFAGNVAVQTTWNLAMSGGVGGIRIVGWMSSATAALSNGVSGIPASKVEASYDGGAFAAFGGAAVNGLGVANATLLLRDIAVSGANRNSSESGTVALRLNLTGVAANTYTAGDYNGTLTLQAITY